MVLIEIFEFYKRAVDEFQRALRPPLASSTSLALILTHSITDSHIILSKSHFHRKYFDQPSHAAPSYPHEKVATREESWERVDGRGNPLDGVDPPDSSNERPRRFCDRILLIDDSAFSLVDEANDDAGVGYHCHYHSRNDCVYGPIFARAL